MAAPWARAACSSCVNASPGAAPSPGPMKVADDKLRSLLGVTDVTFKRGQQRLAIIDQPLQG